jgi:integrase
MHRSAGHDSPTAHAMVRATLAGICRERGTAPRPKTALLVDELRAALATCGERTIDVRDRALVLVGFAGALRRSELVGLDIGDVRFEAEGGSSCAYDVRKPIRRASSRRSRSSMDPTRRRARSARSEHGSRLAKSTPARCSAPSIAPGGSVAAGSRRGSSANG